MRRDGIPYVQNPKNYYPPIDINKLSLEELKQKYLKHCGKSNGNLSACSKCTSPCAEGKRAMQLLANEVYNDPPIPLYGGKTLIERAKEENAKRREAEEAKKLAEKMEIRTEPKEEKKRLRLDIDTWWEASLEYGNQEEYLMKTYNISKTQAKRKIHHARTVKEPPKVEMPVLKSEQPAEKVEEVKETVKPSRSNDVVFKTMEFKIDELMKKQSEFKAKLDEYTKKYKDISEQIDVLCKAMDVFDKEF